MTSIHQCVLSSCILFIIRQSTSPGTRHIDEAGRSFPAHCTYHWRSHEYPGQLKRSVQATATINNHTVAGSKAPA
jgi:hypothetical protein